MILMSSGVKRIVLRLARLHQASPSPGICAMPLRYAAIASSCRPTAFSVCPIAHPPFRLVGIVLQHARIAFECAPVFAEAGERGREEIAITGIARIFA